MVDRYATEAFHRYCEVRHLAPAEARGELELFDDLVLFRGLRGGDAGRWPGTTTAKEYASWTT